MTLISDNVSLGLDFLSRLVTTNGGLMGSCKATKAVVEFSKSCLGKSNQSLDNLTSVLKRGIEFDKAGNFAPRALDLCFANKYGKSYWEINTWTKTANLAALTFVSTIDLANFFLDFSGFSKFGNLVKIVQKVVFFVGNGFGVFNELQSIDAYEDKGIHADQHLEKWKELNGKIQGEKNFRPYYVSKLKGETDAKKHYHYQVRIAQIDKGELTLDQFEKKVKRKVAKWTALQSDPKALNDKQDQSRLKIASTVSKMTSLVLDIGKIIFDIYAVAAFTMPVLGFTVTLVRVNQAFAIANIFLATFKMTEFAHSQYVTKGQ